MEWYVVLHNSLKMKGNHWEDWSYEKIWQATGCQKLHSFERGREADSGLLKAGGIKEVLMFS